MNNLKKKLFAATAMLLVSAVMLGSSTFAWYTLSTAPEIKGVTFNMSANENLEIALDNGYESTTKVDEASTIQAVQNGQQGSKTGNPYTWGNLIDLQSAMAGQTISLKPIQYVDASTLKYPSYGPDGRISAMSAFTAAYLNADASNTVTGTPTGGFALYTQPSNSSADAFSVTYWIRSNKATYVDLAGPAKRANADDDTGAGDVDATDPNLALGGGSFIDLSALTETNASAADDIKRLMDGGYLVVRFDVYNLDGDNKPTGNPTAYYAKAGSVDSNKIPLTLAAGPKSDAAATRIELTASKAKKVQVSVYLDGATLTNKDALLNDIEGIKFNLQFAGYEAATGTTGNISDAMNVAAAAAAGGGAAGGT